MTQVVINTCHGGFSLSDKGVYKYAELKGITLYPEDTNFGIKIYWTVPKNERARSPDMWSEMSQEDRVAFNKAYATQILSNRDFDRDDPTLVAVVNELKSKANGPYAQLEIIEIPDDVKWHIEEYYGIEWIAENHRTWPDQGHDN